MSQQFNVWKVWQSSQHKLKKKKTIKIEKDKQTRIALHTIRLTFCGAAYKFLRNNLERVGIAAERGGDRLDSSHEAACPSQPGLDKGNE